MTKRVWIAIPLITTAEATREDLMAFLQNRTKREIDLETAAFIMKSLMDRNAPFTIDFESATIDRNVVLEALPKRLQRALGYKASGAADSGGEDVQVENVAVGAGEKSGASGAPAEATGELPPAPENPFADNRGQEADFSGEIPVVETEGSQENVAVVTDDTTATE
jgi:hypothetical protein